MGNNNNNRISDEELIKNFQEGDESAFEELVNRFSKRLMHFAYRYVNDRSVAEDIAQDTFLKVYQNKHSYRPIAKFSTWIFTITANLAKTKLRKWKTRQTYSFSNFEDRDWENTLEDEDERENIERATVAADPKIIQKALSNLPDHSKKVIILRDIQELSYDEISKITDVALGTVKSRINRARIKLQEEINKLTKKERGDN